jgi:hypothetical protein
MSDSRQVHRAIKQAVKQLYPEEPRGNVARHLDTLVNMVTGIVLGKSCQLPKMASKIPGEVHPDSRVKQMSRWVQNDTITFHRYFLPFVQPLLTQLAKVRPLVFIMDGSTVAQGCVTLVVSLIYARRALPIAWLVIEGTKGHFPAETHVALLREVKALVPEAAPVVFLGDGEFDSPELQAEANGYGWEYVCRTAKNIQICVAGEWLSLEALKVRRGQREFRKQVWFTQAAYGPVTVIAGWGARYDAPIYLVSNLSSVQAACAWYRKRAHIETFFSDQKSRGFQLDHSHLSDPSRVMRLMLAACFAYLWTIYLGVVAHTEEWRPKIHRWHRRDLSLFQMGLRLLDRLLKNDFALPDHFTLLPESVWW